MSSSAIALASTAAKIQNVAQVRAAMGAVSSTLALGYPYLDSISWIAGEKEAARAVLDTVNVSAQKLYNIYTDDPDLQDEDISTWHAHLAGEVIAQANDALKTVEAAAKEDLWDIASIVSDALTIVGQTAGKTIQSVTNAAAAGATAFVWAAWPTLLLVGAGVLLYVFRDKVAAAIRSVAP